MVTIAAVNVRNYWGAGARYVNALFGGCRRHLTVPFRFVCFTDDSSGLAAGIEARLLPRDLIPSGLHGVYWKMAMFRPGAFNIGERVLYMDLDTVVLSNFDDLVTYVGPFAMLRDPWGSDIPGSGIMAWECTKRDYEIWDSWAEAGFPPHRWGDQGLIAHALEGNVVRLQDVFPSRLRSFNIECRRLPPRILSLWERRWYVYRDRLFSVPYPSGASIVYFHGEPKPHNCRVRWVQEAWRDHQ